jgi:GNAT superfamily N-acetyltransferase
MITIFQARIPDHNDHIKELFWEYLQWANERLNQEYDIDFDIENMLEEDMATLDKFCPPHGRLLLAKHEERIVGLACMRKIEEDISEIKRMYVRPSHRRLGIGRALVNELVEEARQAGYARLRLDSTRFMINAHRLYRSVGFKEIAPYPESEIPEPFHCYWVFMELIL